MTTRVKIRKVLIITLFFRRRPATISRLVVAVFVREAIQRLARRSFAHVREEVTEIFPALTDSNATRPVVFPLFAFRVFAALARAIPRFVRAVIRVAVPEPATFKSALPATFLVSRKEGITSRKNNSPAFAPALPSAAVRFLGGFNLFQCGQSSECPS